MAARRNAAVGDRQQLVGRKRLCLASQRQRLDGLDLDGIAYEAIRHLSDQDLVGRRGLLEPRGDIHCVAGDESLAGGWVAGDDLTGVHTCAIREAHSPATLELVVEGSKDALHRDRRAHGAERVVLMCERKAEHGHDRVADVLLDDTAVLFEHVPHFVEIPRHDFAERFRVERFTETRRALHVREDHCHALADLSDRRIRLERGPTEAA